MTSQRIAAAALLVVLLHAAHAQNQCPPAPNLAGIVIGTILVTLLVAGIVALVAYVIINKRRRNRRQKVETRRQQNGSHVQAHVNPGFQADVELGNKHDVTDGPPLDFDVTDHEKKGFSGYTPCREYRQKSKKSQELECVLVKLVSQDIIGLGFNICGSMRDGIYVSQVLNRGPASESGLMQSGDRILNITISFENMVYEDALTILSYASPYPVTLQLQKARAEEPEEGGDGAGVTGAASVNHPLYRSQSLNDISDMGTKEQGVRVNEEQLRKPSQERWETLGEPQGQLRKWAGQFDIVDEQPAAGVGAESPTQRRNTVAGELAARSPASNSGAQQMTSTPAPALHTHDVIHDVVDGPVVTTSSDVITAVDDSLSASYSSPPNASRDSNDVTVSSVTSTDTSQVSSLSSGMTSLSDASTVIANPDTSQTFTVEAEINEAPVAPSRGKRRDRDDVTRTSGSSTASADSVLEAPPAADAGLDLGDFSVDLSAIRVKMEESEQDMTSLPAEPADSADGPATAQPVTSEEMENASMIVNVSASMLVDEPDDDTPTTEQPVLIENQDDSMTAMLQDYLSNAPPELMQQFGLDNKTSDGDGATDNGVSEPEPRADKAANGTTEETADSADDLKTPETARKSGGGVAFFVDTDTLPEQYPAEKPRGDPKGGIAYTVSLDDNFQTLYPAELMTQSDVTTHSDVTSTSITPADPTASVSTTVVTSSADSAPSTTSANGEHPSVTVTSNKVILDLSVADDVTTDVNENTKAPVLTSSDSQQARVDLDSSEA